MGETVKRQNAKQNQNLMTLMKTKFNALPQKARNNLFNVKKNIYEWF